MAIGDVLEVGVTDEHAQSDEPTLRRTQGPRGPGDPPLRFHISVKPKFIRNRQI